jgi:hypothetical protein
MTPMLANNVAPVLMSLAIVLAQAQPAPATKVAAHPNVYRASIDSVAAWVGEGLPGMRPVVEIDPRILGAQGKIPAAGSALHPAAAFSDAAFDERVVLMPLPRAEKCAGIGQRTCRNDGLFVAVTLDAAAVVGDNATVHAFVRVSRTPTDADRERAQRSANPTAALRRIAEEAGSAAHFRLSLVRRNSLWSVVSRQIIGQS